jgi:hypothetical protein
MSGEIIKNLQAGNDSPSNSEGHQPNSFPLKERVENMMLSIALVVYGGVGIWMDDLYLPAKRSKGIHMHGVSAWIMYAAMLCGAAVMLSVVIDHYDRRNNEHRYVAFQKNTAIVAWTFFWFALFNQIVHIFK